MNIDDVLRQGTVFTTIDGHDSGCVAYGVDLGGERLFVKVPSTPAAAASLRRAAILHAAVRHPAVIAPVDLVAASSGDGLVYPWCDGDSLYGAAARRRFRNLPLEAVTAAAATVVDAHLAVVVAGFVAVDLYDGCFLYDFDSGTLRICDLDEYRPGPFLNSVGRLPGSKRFMAPEEHTAGAIIDERTTVFNLGRAIAVLLAAPDDHERFRGTSAQRAVVDRAIAGNPDDRYPTVAALADAWSDAERRARVGDRRVGDHVDEVGHAGVEPSS
jgi:serine/threonine protein kinase